MKKNKKEKKIDTEKEMEKKTDSSQNKFFDLKSVKLDEVDLSGSVAFHFGFNPVFNIKPTKEDELKFKAIKDQNINKDQAMERISLLRFYEESGLSKSSNPSMFYFKKPSSSKNFGVCGLEVFGTNKTLAEALVIKTALAILEDYGHSNLSIEVNCVGDKESFSKFEKDISSFIKKNSGSFSKTLKQKIKNNPFSLLENQQDIPDDLTVPTPISCLTEQSRIYLTEVLEFLDVFSVPYFINNSLIPNKNYGSHFVFKIYETVSGKKGDERFLLAEGGRYNYLAKKIGYKKDVPCFGATVYYNKKVKDKKIVLSKISKPKFYIMQIGNLAKLKVLNVIEKLRKEKIPVLHSLTKDKITSQVNYAENLKVSHILIIGQKEAVDNSVIVRSVDIREQQNVSIEHLAKHLKNL